MSDSYLPRAEYDFSRDPIRSDSADPDPVQQFRIWYQREAQAGEHDGNRMALSTADTSGRPSVRMVLLKQYSDSGFIFFTDYGSRKARELEKNPQGALLFHWPRMQRQVRIEGAVEKVSREVSRQYFSQRPRNSQAGAVVSRQSSAMTDRSSFEDQVSQLMDGQQAIPCPESWGGFRLIPDRFEFWQGQPGRIHDRILYLSESGSWQRSELQP
ncbi:MAG: pyridoxamine 5'-phosphate oxidase [Planctomycetota bacterium]|nr:pyridoxamine 5'-phosphate oxidase [Planctomycetota bacterium]